MTIIILALMAIQICICISIYLNQKKVMTKQEKFDAMLTRIDGATNEIASDFKVLRDELKAGSVSDASLDALDRNISKLEDLGKDPVDEETTTTTTTSPAEETTTTTTTVPGDEIQEGV